MLLVLVVFSPASNWLQDENLKWFIVLIYAWSIGALLTPLAIRFSFVLNWLDIPDQRKAHAYPTPVLGGLAIIGAFGAALLINFDFSLQMKGVGIGGFLIWLVGVFDDRFAIPAKVKLLVQVIAVAVLIYTGVHVTFLPNTWWGFTGEIILTAVWIIGITNAVNFLDGLDGLAAGMSAIIAFFLALVAVQSGQIYFSYVAIALFASCLAFLPYNFRRGKNAAIFLGDNGATFLGFTLAATAVMGDWAENNMAALVIPILLLGVPIFDMTLTTIMRFKNGQVRTLGEWLAFTGRDHFHHRLVMLGISRYMATWLILSIVAILGISAVALKQARGLDAMLLLVQMAMIFGLICFFMIHVRSKQIKLFMEAQEGAEMLMENGTENNNNNFDIDKSGS